MDPSLLIVATIWSQWLLPLLLFVVGLGLVIFVHELGHFLVAKWMDIKVERFALGFGPRLVGFRKGETDYCICALPLGGYVKMLGQEDFKPTVEQPAPDPRSYEAKSVGARLLVVSAGVVMNIILAAVLVIILCLVGIRFVAPVVGGTARTHPAHTARIHWQQRPASMPEFTTGLKPGDRILEIDGDEVSRFLDVAVRAQLAGSDDTFGFRVERRVDGARAVGTTTIGVRRSAPEAPLRFGIAKPLGRTVAEMPGYEIDTPLQVGDELIAVAGRPIDHGWELQSTVEALLRRPGLRPRVEVTVRRGEGARAARRTFELPVELRLDDAYIHQGRLHRLAALRRRRDEKGRVADIRITAPDGRETSYAPEQVLLDADVMLSLLGMVPRMMVRGVASDADAPARKAGLEPGDVLVSYADEADLTFRRLLELNKAHKDSPTRLVVERDGQRKELQITPVSYGGSVLIGMRPGLEMDRPVVGAVLPDTPADRAGVLPRDRVVRISAGATADDDGAATAPATRPAETRDVGSWLDLFEALRDFRGRAVTVELDSGKRIDIAELGDEQFHPDAYSMTLPGIGARAVQMGPEVRKTNPLSAIAWGAGEVRMFALTTYATIYRWITQDVRSEQFRGIVGIGEAVVQHARQSIPQTIYLMALISAVVAVINFLPLPVVDGGLAVFLVIEKIRGKPVPRKIMNLVQMVGLALLIFVFVALTWQDLARIFRNMW
ncbi:MAG: site-2 protease family protein [Planctomycetota bacterium]